MAYIYEYQASIGEEQKPQDSSNPFPIARYGVCSAQKQTLYLSVVLIQRQEEMMTTICSKGRNDVKEVA